MVQYVKVTSYVHSVIYMFLSECGHLDCFLCFSEYLRCLARLPVDSASITTVYPSIKDEPVWPWWLRVPLILLASIVSVIFIVVIFGIIVRRRTWNISKPCLHVPCVPGGCCCCCPRNDQGPQQPGINPLNPHDALTL